MLHPIVPHRHGNATKESKSKLTVACRDIARFIWQSIIESVYTSWETRPGYTFQNETLLSAHRLLGLG